MKFLPEALLRALGVVVIINPSMMHSATGGTPPPPPPPPPPPHDDGELRPRWIESDLKEEDVEINDTPEALVKGKSGQKTIPTFSCNEFSRIGSQYVANFCEGGYVRKDGQCVCPGRAPKIGNKTFIIKGKPTTLCGICAGADTPAAIKDKLVALGGIYSEDNIVSPLTPRDELKDVTIGDSVFPKFIGNTHLAEIMNIQGLFAGFATSFKEVNATPRRIEQDLLEICTHHENEQGETIKPSIFTRTLLRNVLLSDKKVWVVIKQIIESKVQPLSDYFSLFESSSNDGVAEMENGWLSYYLPESEWPSPPRSASNTFGIFDWHRDAGLTGDVDCRLVLTILRHKDGTVHKRMYFVDRKTGCWFSFECGHGYAVSMSKIVSGFSDGRYMHKVEDAEWTYAQVIQVSLLAF